MEILRYLISLKSIAVLMSSAAFYALSRDLLTILGCRSDYRSVSCHKQCDLQLGSHLFGANIGGLLESAILLVSDIKQHSIVAQISFKHIEEVLENQQPKRQT
jgi:hypothetical protein